MVGDKYVFISKISSQICLAVQSDSVLARKTGLPESLRLPVMSQTNIGLIPATVGANRSRFRSQDCSVNERSARGE